MKNFITKLSLLSLLIASMISCQDEDKIFGSLDAPSNLEINFDIQGVTSETPDGDGSGLVVFTSTAENAISYRYVFSDGTAFNAPSGIYQKRFTRVGVNSYDVTVIANGRGGISSSKTISITVFSNFSDEVAVTRLTGGSSKKWYIAANEPGHLGVGPNNNDPGFNFWPQYYAAAPFEKAGSTDSSCLYDGEFTFSLEGQTLKLDYNNNGSSFFNVAFQGVVNGTAGYDFCYNYDTSGNKTVSLAPSNSFVAQNGVVGQTRGTLLEISDSGFMGYYIGQNTYEIMSITENRMVLRAVAGNDAGLAWYQIFTTTPYSEQIGGGGNEDFTNLIWSDEFDTNGAPDATKWSYDIGRGDNGWGNNEAQYYTDRPENVVVQNGHLVITAKAENFAGASYTSARLKSENKFEFTYGKVEVKAKLPQGSGTWPAIWMLGANYDLPNFTWPACGEIDIMEHRGNQQNVIHGSLHYPGNSGGNPNTNSVTVPNVSNEFKVYSTIWSETSIRFFIDGELFHTFANDGSVPFNHDFFLILNVAMGGSFGGAISGGFTQSTMEIDYVRVYQ